MHLCKSSVGKLFRHPDGKIADDWLKKKGAPAEPGRLKKLPQNGIMLSARRGEGTWERPDHRRPAPVRGE